MSRDRLNSFREQVNRYYDQFDVHMRWHGFPIVLPFFIVIATTGVVLGSLNFRRGMTPHLVVLDAEKASEQSIWFAVSLHGDSLLVTTQDRQHLRIPKAPKHIEDLAPFKTYIESRREDILRRAGVSRRLTSEEIEVVFAVDEQLRYAHIRPFIQVIAEAGINNYGFETLARPLVSASSEQHARR